MESLFGQFVFTTILESEQFINFNKANMISVIMFDTMSHAMECKSKLFILIIFANIFNVYVSLIVSSMPPPLSLVRGVLFNVM